MIFSDIAYSWNPIQFQPNLFLRHKMEIKRYKASQVLLVSNQQKPKTVVYTISGLSNVRTFHMQKTHPHPLQCDKSQTETCSNCFIFSCCFCQVSRLCRWKTFYLTFLLFLSSFKISSWLSVALFMSVCAGSLSQIIEIHVWSWCNGEM